MRAARPVEGAAIHQIPWADRRPPVGSDVRVVVVVPDAEGRVRDLMANRIDALALRDASPAGIAPRPYARHPARPRHVARAHPPRLRRVGIPPLAGDVL